MLNKDERLATISKLIEEKGSIRVADIVENLNVSDMTARRDLTELEELGLLTRIHGGAKSKNIFQYKELSHTDKYVINIQEKKEIALKASELINEGDTIFLGPGTTVELLAKEIKNQVLRIVTNCLPIFEILSEKKTDSFKVYLTGGNMRDITRAFVGGITNSLLSNMYFGKIFFSCNGIQNNEIMTSTFEEGYTQQIAINNSEERYLLLDHTKINKNDFTSFYTLDKLTAVIINKTDKEIVKKLEKYVSVIS